jgi:hypothetical protein
MFDRQQNRVRIDESRQSLLALQSDLTAWLKKRRLDDVHHQYHTQLESLEQVVGSALTELGQALDTIHSDRPPGEVYDACRAFDVRVLWLRRVWDFFREKFDQRDDPRLRPVLKAADEVVWSCYRPVFLRALVWSRSLDGGPAPLPFIESRYSPEAFPRELVPQDLKRDVDLTFLRTHLAALPIPLVRLPNTCVEAPWGLIYLAHELGHHVQYRLLPDRKLVDDTADLIGNEAHKISPAAEESWRNWSREIFADFYSVLLMGTWAARAMLELELRGHAEMSKSRAAYPSPLIRIYLMAKTASLLGLTVEEDLLDGLFALSDGSPAGQEKEIADRVADVLLGLKAYGQTLSYLSSHDADQFRTGVPGWRDALLGDPEPQAALTLEAARLATAGTMAAWNRIGGEADDKERSRRRERLRTSSVSLIAECRLPGQRDAPLEANTAGLGKGLAEALLAQDPKDFETPGESV